MTLEPHISRWWNIANDRRQKLIVQKHTGKNKLTASQEREYELLQKVAEAISDYVGVEIMPDIAMEPVVKVCRCGRATRHKLACDEAHGHQYPKCGVDVCVKCRFNHKVCRCKKVKLT